MYSEEEEGRIKMGIRRETYKGKRGEDAAVNHAEGIAESLLEIGRIVRSLEKARNKEVGGLNCGLKGGEEG